MQASAYVLAVQMTRIKTRNSYCKMSLKIVTALATFTRNSFKNSPPKYYHSCWCSLRLSRGVLLQWRKGELTKAEDQYFILGDFQTTYL